MKKVLSVLYLCCFLVALGSTTHAVEYGGVGVTPANPDPNNPRTQSIFVYSLDPGAQKQDAVRVVNNSNAEKTINIDIVDSETSTGGALACKQTVEPKKEVGSWAKLQKTQVKVAAFKSETVTFEITVPKSASVGEHNGCLVVQDATAAPQKTDQAGVSLSFRSALRMAVTVKGDVFSSLRFTNISQQVKGGNEIIHPYVRNDGNVSVDASIKVALKNVFGGTVASTNGAYPILAQSTADWNFEVKRPFWGGYYKVSSTATYPADPTKALGIVQQQTKTATGPTKWVWVSPAPLALLIEGIVVIVGASAVAWLLYRRRITANWQKYEVKKTDTLQSLAKSHNVNWRHVARVNKIRAPYQLEADSWIYLPKK